MNLLSLAATLSCYFFLTKLLAFQVSLLCFGSTFKLQINVVRNSCVPAHMLLHFDTYYFFSKGKNCLRSWFQGLPTIMVRRRGRQSDPHHVIKKMYGGCLPFLHPMGSGLWLDASHTQGGASL